MTIGCRFDGEVSAPTVCQDGRIVGVYIDDTTPDQGKWVQLAVEKYPPPNGLVIAAIPPGDPTLRFPGAVNALEWYPYGSWSPASAWGPMPHAEAYILQWEYTGFADRGAPNWWQRRKLMREARAHHPRLILLY